MGLHALDASAPHAGPAAPPGLCTPQRSSESCTAQPHPASPDATSPPPPPAARLGGAACQGMEAHRRPQARLTRLICTILALLGAATAKFQTTPPNTALAGAGSRRVCVRVVCEEVAERG